MSEHPETTLLEQIKDEYANTYPNIIFTLTNSLEGKKAELAEQAAEIEQVGRLLVESNEKFIKAHRNSVDQRDRAEVSEERGRKKDAEIVRLEAEHSKHDDAETNIERSILDALGCLEEWDNMPISEGDTLAEKLDSFCDDKFLPFVITKITQLEADLTYARSKLRDAATLANNNRLCAEKAEAELAQERKAHKVLRSVICEKCQVAEGLQILNLQHEEPRPWTT